MKLIGKRNEEEKRELLNSSFLDLPARQSAISIMCFRERFALTGVNWIVAIICFYCFSNIVSLKFENLNLNSE